jgi:hypothetical protein
VGGGVVVEEVGWVDLKGGVKGQPLSCMTRHFFSFSLDPCTLLPRPFARDAHAPHLNSLRPFGDTWWRLAAVCSSWQQRVGRPRAGPTSTTYWKSACSVLHPCLAPYTAPLRTHAHAYTRGARDTLLLHPMCLWALVPPLSPFRFGIAINNDSVVRTVFHKYLHPKEVFISNGVLNQGLAGAINRSGRKDGAGKCVPRCCRVHRWTVGRVVGGLLCTTAVHRWGVGGGGERG